MSEGLSPVAFARSFEYSEKTFRRYRQRTRFDCEEPRAIREKQRYYSRLQ